MGGVCDRGLVCDEGLLLAQYHSNCGLVTETVVSIMFSLLLAGYVTVGWLSFWV